MKAKYRLDVYKKHDDHNFQQRIEIKYFNSRWLKAAYLRALHKRYEGDDFGGNLFQQVTA
jgi:hypothetical protein